MYQLIALLFGLILVSGCVEGPSTKPLTPTEVQVVAQVVSHRLLAPKLTDSAVRLRVVQGLAAAKIALQTTAPALLLERLGEFLGPENKDISDLIKVLVAERVDLAKIPEIEGKAYIFAVLDGVEGGLQ